MGSVPVRAACWLVGGSLLATAAGCLDMASKTGCFTSADCLAPNVCADNRCIANSDGGAEQDGKADSSGVVYAVVAVDQQDTRFYTADGDWAPNELKGQCPADMFVNGISATPYDRGVLLLAHSALCERSPTPIDHTDEHARGIPGGSEARGDASTGDWDVGYTKLECGPSESVTGVAQAIVPSLMFGAILCSRNAPGSDASSCVVLPFFHDRDNVLSGDLGDWAIDYSKNDCGPSYALKGVSVDPDTGEVRQLLCCARLAPR